MTRLMEVGMSSIEGTVMEMGELGEKSVRTAVELYMKGSSSKKRIFEWSKKLQILRDEVGDLSVELIARYQPVATDLRFIRSCMEVSYGFSRFGRYSYDIAELIETLGPISHCDKSAVFEMSNIVVNMMQLGLESLRIQDQAAVKTLYQMEGTVDTLYRRYVNTLISIPIEEVKGHEQARCDIAGLLVLRYLERIADHACYIGDCTYYIVTGESSPRK
jgi:phosphate transport system protein